MITLAASMFDVPGIANAAVELAETLFVVVGTLVLTLVAYRLARERRG